MSHMKSFWRHEEEFEEALRKHPTVKLCSRAQTNWGTWNPDPCSTCKYRMFQIAGGTCKTLEYKPYAVR